MVAEKTDPAGVTADE
nr:hypothetical protein [Escherichia sp. 93.0750]